MAKWPKGGKLRQKEQREEYIDIRIYVYGGGGEESGVSNFN
jgi:hypothetical protein